MTREELIDGILKDQERAQDFIFSKEKLMKLNYEMLQLINECSKHLRKK